jgi:hypothetical protein
MWCGVVWSVVLLEWQLDGSNFVGFNCDFSLGVMAKNRRCNTHPNDQLQGLQSSSRFG